MRRSSERGWGGDDPTLIKRGKGESRKIELAGKAFADISRYELDGYLLAYTDGSRWISGVGDRSGVGRRLGISQPSGWELAS